MRLVSGVWRLTRRAAAAGVLVLSGCESADSGPAHASGRRSDAPPAAGVRSISTRLPSSLSEASAVVRSATQPDVLFTINDSGHEPRLFALDTTGSVRGQWRIGDARNRDWEAASSGPCGSPAGPTAGPACLYVGDVGDNGETRRTRTVYRVIEPQVGAQAATGALAARSLTFRYADGPHDVEAMYVGPDGTIYLITKRPRLDRQRRPRPSLVFALDPGAWLRPDSVAVARLIDSLPVVPGSAPGRLVTDAALAPDGHHVAVRTYGEVFVFAADSSSGRIRMDVPPSVCSVMELGERQGEGVTWLDSSGRLLLMSEGRREPLHVYTCPLPSVGGTEPERPGR
ncbi:MAG TPA: hypothetical protein VFN96_06090 [Gemmatimonadales bacterium]|nr:hypothetical protein [Gemmatimonadales bacterium]